MSQSVQRGTNGERRIEWGSMRVYMSSQRTPDPDSIARSYAKDGSRKAKCQIPCQPEWAADAVLPDKEEYREDQANAEKQGNETECYKPDTKEQVCHTCTVSTLRSG